MKIPKTFVPTKPKEPDPSKLKEPDKQKTNLEDFIIDKKIMGCGRLEISNIDIDDDTLRVRGIEPKLVEKAVFANYVNFDTYDYNSIMLVQYKTKEDLTKNLRKLFKKGILFYENHSEIEFIERFFLKNNIAVYLPGCSDFSERAAMHYRRKGFKQLEYELKGV